MKHIAKLKYIDENNRILAFHDKHKTSYFYLERAEFNRFQKFLERGRYMAFEYGEQIKKINGKKCIKISKVERILQHRNRKAQIYFDMEQIQSEILQTLSSVDTRMFLDLELSMHPFYKSKEFVQEIIQVGYVLEQHDKQIRKFESYIKPVKFPIITERTEKFLSITQAEIDSGMDAIHFYDHLKEIIEEYNPQIFVWGKNDFLAFDVFFELLGNEPVVNRSHFINLLEVYKTYHSKKNDVGLFSCYEGYGFTLDDQKHDALEDAEITQKVFHAFIEEMKALRQGLG